MERAMQSKLKPEMAAEARSYLKLAAQFLRPRSCRLIAIGGLSGTGKSTLAAALAPSLGARVLRSDVTRKRLFGVAPETRLPTNAYTAQVSCRVYQTLYRQAANALAAGYSVIVDAVSLKLSERQSFVKVAEAAGVPFAGIWLEAPPTTLDRRLRARHHDASDASPEVLVQQLQKDPGPIDWVRIDAGAGPEECLAAARRALGLS
jgi:predicted kinase